VRSVSRWVVGCFPHVVSACLQEVRNVSGPSGRVTPLRHRTSRGPKAGAATLSSPDLSWGLCWCEPQVFSTGHLQGAEYAAPSRMALTLLRRDADSAG
jgi:hypothetical protein